MDKKSLEKIKVALNRVQEAPYYQKLYQGINLSSITEETFKELPFAEHFHLAEEPFAFVPISATDKIQAVFTSSGFTGKPKFYYLTKSDIALRGKMASGFFKNFIRPEQGDKILFIVPAGPHGSGVIVHAYAQALNVPYIVVDAFTVEMAIPVLFNREFPFNTLITGNVLALGLLEVCKKKGLKPKELGIRKMSLGGAVLSQETRNLIESEFGCVIFHNYGSSEGDIMGMEGECHDGYHLLSSGVIFEVIDEKGQPAQEGELVLTCFDREGTQIIRYKTGDRIRLMTENCQCSYTTPKIKIIGRSDKMFVVGYLNFYWTSEMDNAISALFGVDDYKIEIEQDKGGFDVLNFYLATRANILSQQILSAIEKFDPEFVIQVSKGLIKLDVYRVNTIERSAIELKGVKFTRVLDRRR